MTQGFGTQLDYEYLLNVLRLIGGAHESLYEQRTGRLLENLQPWRARNLNKDLLMPGEILQATPMGLRFLDDLISDFLPNPSADQSCSDDGASIKMS